MTHILVTARSMSEVSRAVAAGELTLPDARDVTITRHIADLHGVAITGTTEILELEPLPAHGYAILAEAHRRRAFARPTQAEKLADAYAAGQAAAADLAQRDHIDGTPAEVAAALDALPDEALIRDQYNGTAYEASTDPIRRRRYWTPVGDSTADTSTYLADNLPAGYGLAVLHRPETTPPYPDAARAAGYL